MPRPDDPAPPSRGDVVATVLEGRLRQLETELRTAAPGRAEQLRRRTLPNRLRLVEHLLARHAEAPMTAEQLRLDLERLTEGSARHDLPIPGGANLPEVMLEAAELTQILQALAEP